jgi:putative ABC transport system permease protein
VAIVGNEIAQQLFDNENPVGKFIKIGGKKVLIIGVTVKQGQDLLGLSMDQVILLPVNFGKNFINLKNDELYPTVWIKPKKGFSTMQVTDDIKMNLRSIRRLKPSQKDNFALNRASILSDSFEQIFLVIDIAGLIIGGFSILVGGFGIANIMYVSVKEQTRIIGIQKALGAKRSFILQQFLYESVILSILGGILGLFFVFILTYVGSEITGMNFTLSLKNIFYGLFLSGFIGVVAGIAPASKASKLDPVEAISTN